MPRRLPAAPQPVMNVGKWHEASEEDDEEDEQSMRSTWPQQWTAPEETSHEW